MRDLREAYPEAERAWFEGSNTLVLLSVPAEGALLELARRARDREVGCVLVREPDLHEAATALALLPGIGARGLCRGLPLAMT